MGLPERHSYMYHLLEVPRLGAFWMGYGDSVEAEAEGKGYLNTLPPASCAFSFPLFVFPLFYLPISNQLFIYTLESSL